ncbi:hypothetical protein NE237_006738 [Protea cynaroides]|uniref:Uncharacterized protein n=1 Tax=Protea cynaroides TaxID=273540 RepID=A0A9Q0KN63_9MAGN|nr:hypothetical protein NE237_006738 [Protea cynaroides]
MPVGGDLPSVPGILPHGKSAGYGRGSGVGGSANFQELNAALARVLFAASSDEVSTNMGRSGSETREGGSLQRPPVVSLSLIVSSLPQGDTLPSIAVSLGQGLRAESSVSLLEMQFTNGSGSRSLFEAPMASFQGSGNISSEVGGQILVTSGMVLPMPNVSMHEGLPHVSTMAGSSLGLLVLGTIRMEATPIRPAKGKTGREAQEKITAYNEPTRDHNEGEQVLQTAANEGGSRQQVQGDWANVSDKDGETQPS